MEKEVSFKATKSYSTLNSLENSTQNIWFACHGMGQLSPQFLDVFSNLDSEKNYIIAPQAPSKFYLSTKTKRVGANWLTKEQTMLEQANINNYFNAILRNENRAIPNVIMGFSQGVSVALRFLSFKKLNVNHIVIASGKIPTELDATNFNFLSESTRVWLTYGTKDPLLTKPIIREEIDKSRQIFGKKVKVVAFEGKHQINEQLLIEIGNN